MTRDDIIRMADEAMYLNLPIANRNFELQELIKFAELVAAAEREACAKVCEVPIDEIQITDDCSQTLYKDYQECAAAIRAKGKK